MKIPCIYILTNKNKTTLYVGVTSDLKKRIYEHKNKLSKGFASKYNCDHLIYYELCSSMENAIMREKQIKAGSRADKIDLINQNNQNWENLYDTI